MLQIRQDGVVDGGHAERNGRRQDDEDRGHGRSHALTMNTP